MPISFMRCTSAIEVTFQICEIKYREKINTDSFYAIYTFSLTGKK